MAAIMVMAVLYLENHS
ncbi:hypothetical protein ACNKHU_03195 [Shigella flexneri]